MAVLVVDCGSGMFLAGFAGLMHFAVPSSVGTPADRYAGFLLCNCDAFPQCQTVQKTGDFSVQSLVGPSFRTSSLQRLWPRSSSTTVACSFLGFAGLHFALCSFWLQTGPYARHHGRYGPEGQVCIGLVLLVTMRLALCSLRLAAGPRSSTSLRRITQVFSQVFSKSFYQCQVNSRLVTILTSQVF